MGYTHYWRFKAERSELWQKIWPKLIDDTRLIVEAADVKLSRSYHGAKFGKGKPKPPLVSLTKGIEINGVFESAHEAFKLSADDTSDFEFCKTFGKPYDVVVGCVLLRAYKHAPECIAISSDGGWEELKWRRVRSLYSNIWPEDPPNRPWTDQSDSGNRESEGNAEQGADPLQSGHDAFDDHAPLRSDTAFVNPTLTFDDLGNESKVRQARTTVSHLDLGKTIRWLKCCDSNPEHRTCKASVFKSKILPGVCFRLIDVKRRCIVSAPKKASFVALTYVWGGIEQLSLTRASESDVMKDGSLNAAWSRLSTTVRDAILVCEKLGEQYLWTDTLCIVQDSWIDKRIQITWMRQIYASAKLTIGAVSAACADDGLLVHTSQSLEQPGSQNDLSAFIEASPWSQRAWCYQEKVLSHKMMLFTSRGIYLQCQQETIDPTSGHGLPDLARTTDRYNACGGLINVPEGKHLTSFLAAVEYYSRRKLGNLGDRQNAFEGILRRYAYGLDGRRSGFRWGLPSIAFDQALCWRAAVHDPTSRIPDFPSFSWLGWNTAASFDRKIFEHAQTDHAINHTNGIERYVSSGVPKLRVAQDPRRPASVHRAWECPDEYGSFGFPAAPDPDMYEAPSVLTIQASMAKLMVSSNAEEIDNTQGRYLVFPTSCSALHFKTCDEESCGQFCDHVGLPKTYFAFHLVEMLLDLARQEREGRGQDEMFQMQKQLLFRGDLRDSAFRIDNSTERNIKDYEPAEHDSHERCDARNPVGSIWLDRQWREQFPRIWVTDFIALNGAQDASSGDWNITMLMLLRKLNNRTFHPKYERVQVMDTDITRKQWMTAQAQMVDFELV